MNSRAIPEEVCNFFANNTLPPGYVYCATFRLADVKVVPRRNDVHIAPLPPNYVPHVAAHHQASDSRGGYLVQQGYPQAAAEAPSGHSVLQPHAHVAANAPPGFSTAGAYPYTAVNVPAGYQARSGHPYASPNAHAGYQTHPGYPYPTAGAPVMHSPHQIHPHAAAGFPAGYTTHALSPHSSVSSSATVGPGYHHARSAYYSPKPISDPKNSNVKGRAGPSTAQVSSRRDTGTIVTQGKGSIKVSAGQEKGSQFVEKTSHSSDQSTHGNLVVDAKPDEKLTKRREHVTSNLLEKIGAVDGNVAQIDAAVVEYGGIIEGDSFNIDVNPIENSSVSNPVTKSNEEASKAVAGGYLTVGHQSHKKTNEAETARSLLMQQLGIHSTQPQTNPMRKDKYHHEGAPSADGPDHSGSGHTGKNPSRPGDLTKTVHSAAKLSLQNSPRKAESPFRYNPQIDQKPSSPGISVLCASCKTKTSPRSDQTGSSKLRCSNGCKMVFSNAFQLRLHYQNDHQVPDSMSCSHCPRAFKSQRELYRHIVNEHSEIKICVSCGLKL